MVELNPQENNALNLLIGYIRPGLGEDCHYSLTQTDSFFDEAKDELAMLAKKFAQFIITNSPEDLAEDIIYCDTYIHSAVEKLSTECGRSDSKDSGATITTVEKDPVSVQAGHDQEKKSIDTPPFSEMASVVVPSEAKLPESSGPGPLLPETPESKTSGFSSGVSKTLEAAFPADDRPKYVAPAPNPKNTSVAAAAFSQPADKNLAVAGQPKKIRMPNASMSKPYTFDLGNSPNITTPDIFIDLCIRGIQETGLSYNSEKRIIEGIPGLAGEFKLNVFDTQNPSEFQEPNFIIELTINPDPKSLWKDIPTDLNVQYYKPDEDSEKLIFDGESVLVAASKRGRSHAHEGKARDDDFKIKKIENLDGYVIAVADGAGSAKFSRKGSQIACETSVKLILDNLAKDGSIVQKMKSYCSDPDNPDSAKAISGMLYSLLGGAGFESRKSIESESKRIGAAIKDFATTFLLSVIIRFEKRWFIGSFWVGDGGIGIYDKKNNSVMLLGEPDSGEFSGQTIFLTMSQVWNAEEILKRIRFRAVDDFTALILMTDGVTDAKFETEANLARVENWHELWKDISAEVDLSPGNEAVCKQLLKWLDFWVPSNHDDRTIAMFYRYGDSNTK